MADSCVGAGALSLPGFDRGFVMKKLLTFALAAALMLVGVLAALAGPALAAPGFVLSGSFSGPGSDPGLLSDPQRVALRHRGARV
jgi:hypothetical protein